MLNSSLLWLIAGATLCLLEVIFPTAFVAFLMGVSAIVVAAIALVLPHFSLQVIAWLLLSTASILASSRFMPLKKSRQSLIADAHEGETLTEILPGQAGRIRYEGNSWRAICADDSLAIAPQQKVYIVERRGNTLIVLPDLKH